MNPLSIIESWIAKELLNDATLQAIVGNHVYLGAADASHQGIYVLFNLVSGIPFYNLGTKRDHAWGYYDIVVWQKDANSLPMKNAANRVDELFSNFRNRTHTQSGETWRFYSQSTALISRKDLTEPPVVWRGLGGTYRVSASKQ